MHRRVSESIKCLPCTSALGEFNLSAHKSVCPPSVYSGGSVDVPRVGVCWLAWCGGSESMVPVDQWVLLVWVDSVVVLVVWLCGCSGCSGGVAAVVMW